MNYKPMNEGKGELYTPSLRGGIKENREELDAEILTQKNDVLEFLKIPKTLQEALPKSIDRERIKIDERHFNDWSRAFTELIKELVAEEGQQEKKGIGNISAILARLMELSVFDNPRMIRPKEEPPYICMTTRREDSAFDQKSLMIRKGTDGKLNYTCFVSRLTSVVNRLPKIESAGGNVTAWIEQLFADVNVHIGVEHSRPGGVSLEGGNPAQVEKISVSAQPSTKEQAFELFQALRLSQIFMRGIESEVERRTSKVLDTDWKRSRAYVTENETYLYDVIHEKALEAFKTFFETVQGKDLMRTIVDVNVILREGSMTPVIHYEQTEAILGQVWTVRKTLELDSVALGFHIPELRVESLELSPLPIYGRESTEHRRIELTEDQQCSIAIPFYPAMDEPHFGHHPKLGLLNALGKWFKTQKEQESKKERRENNLQEIEKYLTILGIEMDDLRGKTKSEQEILLKKKYRKLAREFHPDMNPDDLQAEEQMKKLAQANQFFFKEFGLDLLFNMNDGINSQDTSDDETEERSSERLRFIS